MEPLVLLKCPSSSFILWDAQFVIVYKEGEWSLSLLSVQNQQSKPYH